MSYILALSVWVVLIASAALTEAQGQGDYVQQPVFYNFQGIPEGPQGQKYVALTFDDGPHQVLTPRLMDILQKTGSKVTFFVMGVKAALHPDILERAVREKHEVANHVWDHPVLTKITPQELSSQLTRTSEAIRAATAQPARTMRPPYGLTNRRNNDIIYGKQKMTVIQWSIDTIDWQHPEPAKIVERVISKVKNGDVILCHDIHANTINAMPLLIDALKKEGFELVTASTLVDLWNAHKTGTSNSATSRLRGTSKAEIKTGSVIDSE